METVEVFVTPLRVDREETGGEGQTMCVDETNVTFTILLPLEASPNLQLYVPICSSKEPIKSMSVEPYEGPRRGEAEETIESLV